ncbi:MAG: PAS domain S-box protein, partial [Microcoleaceae cyanobacterium]
MINDTRITILIIDDQSNNLRFLSEILSQEGYKVKRAISGELGLNAAIISQPDLILLDILMPEMDGYQVCNFLKANPKTQGIPVIFLSALSEVSDKVKGFQVGGVDYVTKPFKAEEVLARITNQITIKKLHLQLEEQNKQLQQEIEIRKKTENNLSTIISNMSEGLMIIDGEGKIVFVNPSTELLWEKTAENLIGEEIGLPLIDGNQTEIYIRQKSGNILFLETRIGEIIWAKKRAYLLTLKDVTARREEQEHLKLLQRAIETTPQGITICDVSKKNQPLLYVNSGFEKITGYSSSEVIGRNCHFLQGDDQEQPEVQEMRQAIATGKNCQVVLQNTRKNGSKFWNEVTISPVDDKYGSLTHYVGVQVDISDRIAAEQALRESEARFRSMADSTTMMICVTDSKNNCTFFNKTWLEFTGSNFSEALERGWLECVHPEERAHCEQTYAQSQETKENFQLEYRMCRFDGEYRWVLDTGRPRFTPNGTFAGYISAAIDITDRKATETQLQLVNERLKFLLVSSPAIIYSCKVTGNYGATWISDNVTSVTGYQPREFTENSGFWLNHIHPDDVAKVSAETSKIMESGYLCHEYRFLHKNGSYIWFHDELKVVYNHDGMPIEAVGYWLDITERKQAEIELSRAKISLERQIQRALVLGEIT